jgi:hyaluronan synthase
MIDVSFAAGRRVILVILSTSLVAVWAIHRLAQTVDFFRGNSGSPYVLLLTVLVIAFALQLWLAWRERPFTPSHEEQACIDELTVCLNVPVYNEDPDLLDEVLASIFAQTRLPNRVEVVDDGSDTAYAWLRARWLARVPNGVVFSWVRTPNRGKRQAQMTSFANAREDVLVTIDSDTVLHPRAIEEGLKPFADPHVASVAGLVLAFNKHKNLLTRLQDLILTSAQLTLRSAHSQLGSVTVNSGAFALYRRLVIQVAHDGYLNEQLAGRPVRFSDDSLLTLYALVRGRTVQQTSAIAFSAWPETISHHLRQQLRWTRGSFIRSLWRLRYLPMRRAAFWLHVAGHAQFIGVTAMFALVVGLRPEVGLHNLGPMLAITMLLSYAVTARTLLIRRSDESLRRQLAVYALSPLVVPWALFVYRPIRLYGMLTCLRTDWGTRRGVEVAAPRASVAPVHSLPTLVYAAGTRPESVTA